MELLTSTEYSFLTGCLEMKPKGNVSESFALSIPSIITRIHVNRPGSDGETAVAVSGSNQTAGFFEHTNYVMYLASRIQSESPAYPLSNATCFMRIRQGMREK
jgi:hypothetical protein